MPMPTFARAAALLCVTGLALGACGVEARELSTSRGDDDTSTTTTDGRGEDGPATTSTTEQDEEERTTTTARPAGPSVEVTESGFSLYASYDDSRRATAGAVLENTGEEMATFFEVVFSFKDASGKPVGTETAYIQAIDGGGTGYAEVRDVELTGEPKTVDVAAVVDEDSMFEGRVIEVTVESLAPEDYGDGVQVNGTAANDTDEVAEYAQVTCVLRSGGKIVGGASGILDTLVPGGSVAWEATGPVQADAAACAASTS